MLTQLEHPQPPTPIKYDNETSKTFINNNTTQERSKSWDMRYHWLRYQEGQNNFDVYWKTSENIESDYYTKHFTAYYHRNKRPTHVLDGHVKS